MANVGSGAASGAAIGSAISPGLGTVIGGIGGAAISAIGSFFGNKSNRKASREAFERESKFAREERLAQQQWIEQMYERNNSYNSPAAQSIVVARDVLHERICFLAQRLHETLCGCFCFQKNYQ